MAEPTARQGRTASTRFSIDLHPADARAIDVLVLGKGITRYAWLRQAVWAAMEADGLSPVRGRQGNPVRTVVTPGATW